MPFLLAMSCSLSQAIVPKKNGWTYSLEKVVTTYTEWERGSTVMIQDKEPTGGGWIKRVYSGTIVKFDPITDRILSGRLTLSFDPNVHLSKFGWYGEFGNDPMLAPPVPGTNGSNDVYSLQDLASASMTSNSFFVDNNSGLAVVEFNWGIDGLLPTMYMDAEGHFNSFGMIFDTTDASFTPTIVGSLQDIETNGESASTYIKCTSGYCGIAPVPEPESSALCLVGLLVIGKCSIARRIT